MADIEPRDLFSEDLAPATRPKTNASPRPRPASGGLAGQSSQARRGQGAGQSRQMPAPSAKQAKRAAQAQQLSDNQIARRRQEAAAIAARAQTRQAPSQEELFPDEEGESGRRSIGDAIRGIPEYLRGHSMRALYMDAMDWIYRHPAIVVLVGVLMIAIGLLVNRYISFGSAIVFLVLGWLMGRFEDKDSFLLYGVALGVFVIPYLF